MKKPNQSTNFIQIPELYFALTEIKGINYGHVCLLSKIKSLSVKSGKCTASNAYFANLLHTQERSIQRMMADLKNNNPPIIKTFEEKQGMKTTTRFIYVQQDNIKNIIESILGSEKIDDSLTEAHDNNGMTTRQNLSEDMKELVEADDNVGNTTRQDRHPNNRLEENKKENNRIKEENEADASDELNVFANASVNDSISVSSEQEEKVITLMKKGYKYNRKNPQIQKETGLNGSQIHEIISSYFESSGKGSNYKDEKNDLIPLASGAISNYQYKDFEITFADDKTDENFIYILDLVTDPHGEYRFDYYCFENYLKEKYNVNISGKFEPLTIEK